MNESDIKEVVDILKSALCSKDWEDVEDAKTYLEEYLDEYYVTDDESY